jgi:L-lactate utilization protein LutB
MIAPDNPMYEPERWFNEKVAEKCVGALKRNGFAAYYAKTRDEARKIVLDAIPAGASVGIGGSVTVRDLGIHQALKERGNPVYDHWDASLSPAEKAVARDNQVKADVFLSSTNALTMDGALVNTDGSGNRVASMIFGPKISVVVCGYNKMVPDLRAAVQRIRRFAAPVNYRRLNASAPCVEGGDCKACEPKSCRITTIIEAKPAAKAEFVVVIVGEKLGY